MSRRTAHVAATAATVVVALLLLLSIAPLPSAPAARPMEATAVSRAGGAAVVWTNLTGNVTGSPLPLYPGSLLAFDAHDNYTVLLGFNGTGLETLEYRFGEWTALPGAGGAGMEGVVGGRNYNPNAMAYDPALGGIVLFSGDGTTWFFQSGAWAELPTTNDSAFSNPTADASSLMTYDSADGYLLLSDADVSTNLSTGDSSVWALSSTRSWSAVAGLPQSPEVAKGGSAVEPMMTYDAHDGYVLALNDGGWTYSYTAGRWTNRSGNDSIVSIMGGTTPANRSSESLGYDPPLNETILFGGSDTHALSPNTTWAYRSGTWTNVSGPTDPPPRCEVAMTFDVADGYMLAVGGNTEGLLPGGPIANQTWAISRAPVEISPVDHVTISAAPSPTDVGVPVNLSVSFTGNHGPFTYRWSNGATTNQTVVRFGTPGPEVVTVLVTDAVGTDGTGSWTVVVNPLPAGSISFPSRQTVGIPEIFRGASSNGTGPYQYAWNFGDGTTASTSEGSHTYTQAGPEQVNFTAVDSVGQSTTAHRTVTVAPSLRASLNVTNATPSLEQPVLFTVTVHGGLGADTYAWTGLPTGCVSVNNSSIGCASTQSGIYPVTVNVTDGYPGSATATVNVTVIFEFSLSVSTLTPLVGQTVTVGVLSATPTTDLTYLYTGLPPGCPSENASRLTCTPTAPGRYTVTVTVTDVPAEMATSRQFSMDVGAMSPPSPWPTDLLLVGLGALGLVAAVAAGRWWLRRPPGRTR